MGPQGTDDCANSQTHREASVSLHPIRSWHALCGSRQTGRPCARRAVTSDSINLSQKDSGIVMRVFRCDHCSRPVFFENTFCSNCGHKLAYLADLKLVASLDPADEGATADGGKPS